MCFIERTESKLELFVFIFSEIQHSELHFGQKRIPHFFDI